MKNSTLIIITTLVFISALLPIFSGYSICFFALMYLAKSKHLKLTSINPLGTTYYSCLKPIAIGSLTLTMILLLTNIGSAIQYPYAPTVASAFSKWSHLMVKYALLPMVLCLFGALLHKQLSERSQLVDTIAKAYLSLTALHFVYAIVQSRTGIDWVHGFDAILGEHRKSGEIFRISGFMAHPLTLSYNLGLLFLATACLSRGVSKNFNHLKLYLYAAATFLALTLLISGSRAPIILTLGCSVLLFHKEILTHWKKYILLSTTAAGLLIWEGSLLRRFAELFENSDSIYDLPRFKFWSVHWQAFLDHPILGTGIKGRSQAIEPYYQSIGFIEKQYNAHNIYLQFLADSGLIGFTGFFVFCICLLLSCYRISQLSKNVTIFVFPFLMMISGIIQNNWRDSEIVYCFWLCFFTLTFVQISAATKPLTNR